jgi:hypothetical protein
MKILSFVVSGLLGVGAILVASAPAWAHVVVSPEEVTAGDYETLTVSVPTEKEIPTTKIRVEVTEGVFALRRGGAPAGVPAVPHTGPSSRATGRIPVEDRPDLLGRQRRRVDRSPGCRGARLRGRGGLRPIRASPVQP